MEWLSWIETITSIFVSIVTIGGFLWGGWQWVIKPFRKMNNLLDQNSKKLNENSEKLNKTIDCIDNDILPFMKSMTAEFSKNSGKSIKDQINRIDENTKMSDIRIKLIATNLVLTGMFECNAQGKCIWVNRALAELFGLEREEMLDTGWLAAVHDDERADVWAHWIYSVQNNIPYESEYTVYNKKARKEFQVRVASITTRSDTGKILGFFGTVVKVEP